MRYLVSVIFFSLSVFCLVYLSLPSPKFPLPPPDSLISTEPADTESIYRRAYYTNYSRSEIMAYYKGQFDTTPLQFRLNYPPEEAYDHIRDQTRSSWLEELVHPGRESLFINGFYPTKPTEQINIDGIHYLNKISIHMYPSQWYSRLTSLFLFFICAYWLKKEYEKI